MYRIPLHNELRRGSLQSIIRQSCCRGKHLKMFDELLGCTEFSDDIVRNLILLDPQVQTRLILSQNFRQRAVRRGELA